MYRIIFKPALAAWVVQLNCFGFLWSSVKDGSATRTFDNYEDALKYVYSVGLDQVYKDWSARPALFQEYQTVDTRPPYLVRQRQVV